MNAPNPPAQPNQPAPPWYFKTSTLVVALLSVGPFALPLLWFNPRHSAANKILWTLVTVAATMAIVSFGVSTLEKIMQQYRDIGLIK